MTEPLGRAAADAFVEFHLDTTKVVPEAEKAMAELEVVAEVQGDVVGHTLGKHIGEGVKKEIKDQGPSVAREIEKAVEKEVISPRPRFSFRSMFGGRNRTSQTREVVQGIEAVVGDAVKEVTSAGSPLETVGKTVGKTIADGIGSVFNVSGKSPLIALLVPVFGELGVLIGGLVEAIGPLLGLLTTIPSVIAGIGLSVGAVVLAFHGLGGAISGAFAAKNAKELKEAIKDLTPAAQDFIKQILPLKDIFAYLTRASQQNFFYQLATSAQVVIEKLTPLLNKGLPELAGSMGELFRQMANFLGSPSMVYFLTDLFPATEKWLADFGPAFSTLLIGLIDIARASLPFLSTIGHELNDQFTALGQWLTKLSEDKDFKKWLDRMVVAFEGFLEVLKAAGYFIGVLLDSIDKAGGQGFLDEIALQLALLADFFKSDAGIAALKGFIDILIFLGGVFIGLVLIISFVVAGFEGLIEVLGHTGDFFEFIGQKILDAWHAVLDWLKHFPDYIVEIFKEAQRWLYNAGKDIVLGLMHGIESTGTWLKDQIMDWVRRNIPEPVRIALGIHSPSKVMAELGKQSAKGFAIGFDDEFAKNAANMDATIGGFATNFSGSTAMNTNNQNVAFGPGAIQVNFNGSPPSQAQATQAGEAIGAGINNQLAVRNARLAVRTF